MAKPTPYSASIRIRPRRDGTVAHDVRYRHNGQSRTTSFENDAAAQRWANLVRHVGPEEALKLLTTTTGATPTVAEFAETYINGKSGVEPKTLEHYRLYMRANIGPAMGALPLDAIDRDRVAAFVNGMAEAGYAGKTIRNRHGFLSGMFEEARDRGLITRNPCAKSRLPETEQEEMVFLTPAEFAQLFEFIPEQWKLLVLLTAATGLRWGEVSALRKGDFDLQASTVRVSRAWKSSKSKGWYIGPPKTKKSKRTITVPPDVIAALRPLLASGTEYVFVNKRGDAVRQQNFYDDVWNPARRMANGLPAYAEGRGQKRKTWAPRPNGVWDREPAAVPLGKMPRFHDLRHSHAFWLIRDRHPLSVVQQRLGHESIQTTSDTYGHLSPDMLYAASASIGLALEGVGTPPASAVRLELTA